MVLGPEASALPKSEFQTHYFTAGFSTEIKILIVLIDPHQDGQGLEESEGAVEQPRAAHVYLYSCLRLPSFWHGREEVRRGGKSVS